MYSIDVKLLQYFLRRRKLRDNTPSLGRAFSEGWQAFAKYPGLAIGGYLLYAVINAIGQSIPFLNILFAIFIVPPLAGGLILLYLNIAKGNEPTIGNLFERFSSIWQFIGANWLLALYVMLAYIPGAIIMAIGFAIGAEEGAGIVLIVIGGIVAVVVAIVILIRWAFIIFIIADGWNEGRIMPAFDRSAKITEGRRPAVWWTLFVLGLFGIVGVIGLIIGIFFTSAIAACAMAAYYLQLKEAYLSKTQGTEEIEIP